MIGIQNRLPGARICEVGTCGFTAAFTEHIKAVPGDPKLRHERHALDIVLCHVHEQEFQITGLDGTITAYGDEIVASLAK